MTKEPCQRCQFSHRPRKLLVLFLLVLFTESCQSFTPSAIGTITARFSSSWSSAKFERPYTSRPTSLLKAQKVDKGFNLLEVASQVVPQGRIVQTAKESWKFVWRRFMTELAPQDPTGTYQRPSYTFGNTLGSSKYPLEAGRYHVYVGNPCPWCHRVKLVYEIIGLQDKLDITMLVDDPIQASRGGWVLPANPGRLPNNIQDLRQLYDYLSPGYKGRCTAPLLVDWKTRTIVSNESKDIVRMLPLLANTKREKIEEKQNSKHPEKIDLTPAELQTQIDKTNEWIYSQINNGVYQCGFATSQQGYDRASASVTEGMARVEELLSQNLFLNGDSFTESDILLLPTMLRYDSVYAPLFGAGGSRHWRLAVDYPHIHAWLQRCWKDIPGVSKSIDLDDASKSYYKQLFPLNPGGILPSTKVTPQLLGLEE